MNARNLAEKIWADVRGRSGNGFEDVDDVVKEEILTAWVEIIGQAVTTVRAAKTTKPIPTEGHIRKESPRAAGWELVFGSLTVPLISPVSFRADSPAGIQEFYQCDLGRLSAEQRERAIEDIVARFGIARSEVVAGFNNPNQGLPILAEDVSVTFDGRLLL